MSFDAGNAGNRERRLGDPEESGVSLRSVAAGSISGSAADLLRAEILRIGSEGVFLGYETDLVGQLQISRASFRQAARILEAEQLLTVRRGQKGGFYTRRPSAEIVSRMASIYLRSEDITAREMLRMSTLLRSEAVAELATTDRVEIRNRFDVLVKELNASRETASAEELLDGIARLGRLFSEVADNRAIGLFIAVLNGAAMLTRRQDLEPSAERARAYLKGMHDVARAVRDRDPARASALLRELYQRTYDWLER